MKKFIAMLSVMMVAILTLSAQPQQNRQNRPTERSDKSGNFTEFQIQILTKQLHLDEQKKEAFVKLYTEYSQKSEALQPKQLERHQEQQGQPRQQGQQGQQSQHRQQGQQGRQNEQDDRFANQTDAEVEAQILETFVMAEKNTALKREYYYKFKEILTPKQIMKMYDTERRLRERIVSESNRRTEESK